MTGAAVLAALAVPGLGAGAALLLWPDRRADRRARIRLVAGGPAIAAAEPPPERWHHRLGRLLSMSPAVGQEESRKLAELLARPPVSESCPGLLVPKRDSSRCHAILFSRNSHAGRIH